MAARREKVSRWESGRAVPERTAQLAIAHIHAVPHAEVLRLDWPEWLHLANGDARQLELPWTTSAVPEAILDAIAGREESQQDYLLATGWAARSLMENWLDAMTEEMAAHPAGSISPATGRVRGPRLGGGTESVLEACTRLRTLHRFAATFSAGWLVAASELELRHLADHFLSSPEALNSGRELLVLAAEGLAVCGFIARLQGQHVGAQRYYVAALRCATAANDPETAAAIVTLHVGQYLDLHLHEEAAELIEAVKKLLRHDQVQVTDPTLLALLHTQSARVHAQRGDDLSRRRALTVGRHALTSATSPGGIRILPLRSEDWLSCMDAVSLLDLDQPDRAIRHFEPVLAEHRPELQLPPCVHAMYLLRAAETQVALGDATAGAESANRAATLLGGVRAAASERVRLALRAYAHLPEVTRFLDSA
ncbi:transcriptional regulator [Streptomyces sp. NPDC052040]|uniref:transcriptional regulator n=1 Tax=unclassified Streptomyces TaxID=2593676 RepID=UPI0037D83352